MKKYFSILFLLVTLTSSNLFAQSYDSLQKIYNSQTIYRYGNKYHKGNEKLTYADLKLEFSSPSTQGMYKKSKSRLNISRVFKVASLGAVVASIFIKTNVSGSIQLAIGTGLLTAAAVHYQTKSLKYLEKAIWERNNEVLFNNVH